MLEMKVEAPRSAADLKGRSGADSTDGREHPTWGQERIAAELPVRLGLRFSPRMIGPYMGTSTGPKLRLPSQQRWQTFVRNHTKTMVAISLLP